MAALALLFATLLLILTKTLCFYFGFNWLLLDVFPQLDVITMTQAFALVLVRGIIVNTSHHRNETYKIDNPNVFKALTKNISWHCSILIIVTLTHLLLF